MVWLINCCQGRKESDQHSRANAVHNFEARINTLQKSILRFTCICPILMSSYLSIFLFCFDHAIFTRIVSKKIIDPDNIDNFQFLY